jgi:hypothetical protein
MISLASSGADYLEIDGQADELAGLQGETACGLV